MNPVIDRYLTEKYCKPYDGPELCLQVKKLAVKPWTEKLLNVPHVVESYMKGISEYLKKNNRSVTMKTIKPVILAVSLVLSAPVMTFDLVFDA